MIVVVITFRILQVILAIFAFATTTSHYSTTHLQIVCKDGAKPINQTISYSYPFSLDHNKLPLQPCNATANAKKAPWSSTSSAQFYVFIGVMAFLYSVASVVVYVCCDHVYRNYDKVPITERRGSFDPYEFETSTELQRPPRPRRPLPEADFLVSVVFGFLFLVSSSAWAQGLSDLKYYSSPDHTFIYLIQDCKQYQGPGHAGNAVCTGSAGDYAGLNVSIIFGFLNCAVWIANLWFLYKETKWFKINQTPVTSPPMSTPTTPSDYMDAGRM